ncbi:MAG TPA: hypothetical protein VIN07_03790, partial [Flavipsychrobacter sp.]
MRYLLYTLLFLLSSVNYAAGQQNLVPNSNFEDTVRCPMGISDPEACVGWRKYNNATSDYFHTCRNAPVNSFGNQIPYNGNGYMGLYTMTNSGLGNGSYKEYIAAQMSPMMKGIEYMVAIKASLADKSAWATNDLGIYLYDIGPTTPVTNTNNGVLNVSPQVSFANYGVITDTVNWVNLTKYYVADSAYDNLVIGGFLASSQLTKVSTGVSGTSYCYMYLDAVEIVALDSIGLILNDTLLCSGDTIQVPYFIYQNFNSNNTFIIQLSDSSGEFNSAINIGTISSDTTGVISCIIPSNTPIGIGYRIRLIGTNPGDTSRPNLNNIRIGNIPAKPVAGNNAVVCTNDTLKLTATTITLGVTWSWTGPDSFFSFMQNPVIPAPTSVNSGSYIVAANIYGCNISDTTIVTVTQAPLPITASSNNLFCESDTLYLSANNTTPSGATYSWTGPNNFTSNQQNPVLPSTTSAASGSYIVTADRLGCKVADTVTVTVKPLPTFTATSNTPVCTGNNLLFGVNSSFTGVSYSWAGPGGFNASIPTPFISNAISTNSGTYIATATLNGCSYKDTAIVLIKPLPTKPVATNNSPFCQGDTVYLTSVSTTNGVSYSWSGPGSFSSATQNPFVYPASSSVSGHYIVTVTKDGCISKDTTTVTVKPRPDTITVSNNSPLCHGDTLKLFSDSSSAGVVYAWTGPGNFTSAANDTIIANAAPAASGWYRMMVDLNGCSYSDSTLATIYPIPSTPALSYNNPLCLGETLNLSANTVSGGAYSWSGPGSFNASVQNPGRANMQFSDTGKYYAIVTVNGCTSPKDSIRVVINPLPFVVITANPADSVCQGDPATFTAYPNNHGGTPQYQWYINNQLAGTNPVLTTTTLNDQDIILCRMTDNTKCSAPYTDESNDITMTVLPWLAPSVSITATPNRPLKPWEYVTFTATATNAGNNPVCQWKRNGVDVVGATGSVWSANTLNDNDSISVEIVSSYKCPQPPAA